MGRREIRRERTRKEKEELRVTPLRDPVQKLGKWEKD